MSSKKHTIIVCDHIHDDGLKILKSAEDIILIYASDVDKNELLAKLENCDVAITRSSTNVDEKFLDSAKNLKAIIRAGVGYDNVDMQACSKKGVIAMNIPTANTIAAVELTMTHILACMRKFPFAHEQLKNQRIWKREDWYGNELFGKKLGIIGFGNIGHRVGIRAKAFEMDVVAFDPYISPAKALDLDIKYTRNFDDILACDIITIHTPKNSETINMINEEEISKMKDGVILINCARGGLYNEDALYKNLKSKKIAMAGIDVFTKEPATTNKLLDLDNTIVTAHLGANTKESQKQIAIQAANNAIDSARGVAFPNALNLPIDEKSLSVCVKSFIELAQKISFLAAQITKSPIRSISLSTQGDISKYLEPLLSFACVGALSVSLGDEINYINANFIAKDNNILLKTSKQESQSGYSNKISLKLGTKDGFIDIAATVFGENIQRIVEIDGFSLDIEPKGKMILFRNLDVPGVIGDVGKILGDYKINVADFRLARCKKDALALIIVDEKIPTKLIKELENIKAEKSVAYVEI